MAAELKNPKKQLPLAINTALPTVIVSYVLVNAVYYVLLPWSEVGITDAIAVVSEHTRANEHCIDVFRSQSKASSVKQQASPSLSLSVSSSPVLSTAISS